MFWKSLTANNTVIQIIERRYKIFFIDTLSTAQFCNSKTAFEDSEFVVNAIEDLLISCSAVETSFVP